MEFHFYYLDKAGPHPCLAQSIYKVFAYLLQRALNDYQFDRLETLLVGNEVKVDLKRLMLLVRKVARSVMINKSMIRSDEVLEAENGTIEASSLP